MPVASIITMLQNDFIDLQPAFQRKENLWDATAQSRLIESLLLKLPLPSMYFEYNVKTKKYTVIDGLQRLCAIRNFAVNKTLRLSNLQFIGNLYDGRGYDDLDFQDQLAIGLEEISVNVLKNTSPHEATFIIFQRLNSGGTKLSNQEIRNALYPGPGNNLVNQLATSPLIEELKLTGKDRMNREELVLRALAFTIMPDSYNGRMETFLNKALEKLNEMPDFELGHVAGQFTNALQVWRQISHNHIFKLPTSTKEITSKPLFDALISGLSRVPQNQYGHLIDHSPRFNAALDKLCREDLKFIDAVGRKSDRKEPTAYRLMSINNLIAEQLISNESF